MIKRNPNYHYGVWTVRLSKTVLNKLRKKREKSGLSWNLFLCELMNERYANETVRGVRRKRLEVPKDRNVDSSNLSDVRQGSGVSGEDENRRADSLSSVQHSTRSESVEIQTVKA